MKTLSNHAGRILLSDTIDGVVGFGSRDLRGSLTLRKKITREQNFSFKI